jgi:hypothetical protein
MKTIQRLLVLPLMLLTAAAGTAFADQQHVVDPARVATTLAERTASQDADRAAIRTALGQPDVQRVARTMGVSLDAATAAVDTLSGSTLAQAASTAQQVNDQLVGGDSTVTISTTTLIIVLLIVLLIIVLR